MTPVTPLKMFARTQELKNALTKKTTMQTATNAKLASSTPVPHAMIATTKDANNATKT